MSGNANNAMLTTVATGDKTVIDAPNSIDSSFSAIKTKLLSGLESRELLAVACSYPTPSRANRVVLVCIVSSMSNPHDFYRSAVFTF